VTDCSEKSFLCFFLSEATTSLLFSSVSALYFKGKLDQVLRMELSKQQVSAKRVKAKKDKVMV
jgi:hypothetical protein